MLLLEHGPNGALGLVLNRPAKGADELSFPIYVGGPCQMEGVLMLHGHADWVRADADRPGEVCPGVYLGDSQSFERLGDMPDDANWKFRVFTGYAGWGPKQLESEMAEGAWIVLTANGERLSDTPPDQLWERLAPPTIREPSLN